MSPANRFDNFPRALLGKVQLARSRGLDRFTVKHYNGDVLYVTLDGEQINVLRIPRVKVPSPIGLVGQARMRLVTTEAELQRDVLEGITSHTALDWRG